MRVLITDAASAAGRRLTEHLRARTGVEVVIGAGDASRDELAGLINAAGIDTVVDLARRPERLLGACEAGPVRKLVLHSAAHYYGFDAGAPAFVTEATVRTASPKGALERHVIDAEAAVAGFAARNPDAVVTIIRFADELGGDGNHQAILRLPFVPGILGFDPRWQFIDERDVTGVLVHAVIHDLAGVFNAAADGVLALSEVASLLGKPLLPVLPPLGLGIAAAQLARLGVPAPVELIDQLKLGRGLDNRRLKATGYSYRYTSRESVLRLATEQMRKPLLRRGGESLTG